MKTFVPFALFTVILTLATQSSASDDENIGVWKPVIHEKSVDQDVSRPKRLTPHLFALSSDSAVDVMQPGCERFVDRDVSRPRRHKNSNSRKSRPHAKWRHHSSPITLRLDVNYHQVPEPIIRRQANYAPPSQRDNSYPVISVYLPQEEDENFDPVTPASELIMRDGNLYFRSVEFADSCTYPYLKVSLAKVEDKSFASQIDVTHCSLGFEDVDTESNWAIFKNGTFFMLERYDGRQLPSRFLFKFRIIPEPVQNSILTIFDLGNGLRQDENPNVRAFVEAEVPSDMQKSPTWMVPDDSRWWNKVYHHRRRPQAYCVLPELELPFTVPETFFIYRSYLFFKRDIDIFYHVIPLVPILKQDFYVFDSLTTGEYGEVVGKVSGWVGQAHEGAIVVRGPTDELLVFDLPYPEYFRRNTTYDIFKRLDTTMTEASPSGDSVS
ncbi:MAG: hypothetical protein LBT03_03485 [Holosporales bacterium]|jgi:hypothetical protein|nr:hypothetical protein [Holosporales bacterium]